MTYSRHEGNGQAPQKNPQGKEPTLKQAAVDRLDDLSWAAIVLRDHCHEGGLEDHLFRLGAMAGEMF